MMTEGNTSTRSSSRANGGAARGTVKVRNVAEGVVYHLTFDGDLGRLTGGQLKQHIESIAGIPAARQQLSVGGHMMADASLASSFGVRDGTVIMMDMVSESATAPASEAGGDRRSEAPAAKSTTNSPPPEQQQQQEHEEPQPREERRPPPPKSRPADEQHAPAAADQHDAADPESELHRIEAEIAEIKRRERELARRHHEVKEQSARRERGQSVVHHYHSGGADGSQYVSQPRRHQPHHGNHSSASSAAVVPKGRAPARGAAAIDSDGDEHVEIEVEVEEEPGLTSAWLPSRSVDIDEMRLQQQDYVWKMEQVRFETERMTREREMRRQQQELEYQAALLDRERVEMERKTTMERAEFEDIQAREREDVDIEARYTPMLGYHGSTASHSAAPHMHSAHVTSSGLLP